jgi:tRNA-dihydrouridine synthase B
MIEHYGEVTGVRMAKKHLGWYSSGKEGSAEFRNLVMKETNPLIVKQLVKDFFDRLMEMQMLKAA